MGPAFVFTSNVDGQFRAAGFDPERVAEVHGCIHRLQCLADCGQPVWPADGVDVTSIRRRCARSRRCRPALAAAPGPAEHPHVRRRRLGSVGRGPRLAAYTEFVRAHRRGLAVVEIGAGTALPTVRRQAELASAATGALIRINTREPHVRDPRAVGIAAPAAETLLALSGSVALPAPRTP